MDPREYIIIMDPREYIIIMDPREYIIIMDPREYIIIIRPWGAPGTHLTERRRRGGRFFNRHSLDSFGGNCKEAVDTSCILSVRVNAILRG